MNLRVAVDAMGGDAGPSVTVAAILKVLAEVPDLSIDLMGDQQQLAPLLRDASSAVAGRLVLMHAPDAVQMDDAPLHALRHKPQSSMRMAIDRVALGAAQACVSAGNTGALVAMGHHALKTLPGIERAAMCTTVPTVRGHSYVLDVGAAVVADAQQLLQYALMGTALATMEGCPRPVVGLLNVGAEAMKGTPVVQEADRLLRLQPELDYRGFVEGDDLFSGSVDVIVCDGFAGNIALKASEGVARLVAHKLADRLQRRFWLRCLALLVASDLKSLRAELDPEHFNGACLLGLRGLLVKSHGSASAEGFAQSLRLAVRMARRGLVPELEARLQRVVM